MEPILGGLLGGVARLAPEVIKFFDRRNERKHELALAEHQLELIRIQHHTRMDEITAGSEAQQAVTALEALREAVRAQAQPTGIRWVDALSASVRPVWTYLVLLAWATVKYVNVFVALRRAEDWEAVQAILWTADDATMLSTLATFWFLDRVIRKSPR